MSETKKDIKKDIIVGVASSVATAAVIWLAAQTSGAVGSIVRQALIPDLPTGAVVAFDGECPIDQGWVRYAPAASRFLIGAATLDELDAGPAALRNGSNDEPLTERQLGSSNGTENVRLSIEEMPSHTHRISTDIGIDAHNGLGGSTNEYGITRQFTDQPNKNRWTTVLDKTLEPSGGLPDGSTKGHYNMPPYLAVYFCIKKA